MLPVCVFVFVDLSDVWGPGSGRRGLGSSLAVLAGLSTHVCRQPLTAWDRAQGGKRKGVRAQLWAALPQATTSGHRAPRSLKIQHSAQASRFCPDLRLGNRGLDSWLARFITFQMVCRPLVFFFCPGPGRCWPWPFLALSSQAVHLWVVSYPCCASILLPLKWAKYYYQPHRVVMEMKWANTGRVLSVGPGHVGTAKYLTWELLWLWLFPVPWC